VVRLPHLLAALLCGLAAALALGCADRSNLIPAGRASELTQQLTDLQASIAAGECDGLSGRVTAFRNDAADLGGAVDRRLRARINDGAASLREHAVGDCQAAADAARQQTETQPSDTTPPDAQTDTTATETQTQTVTTETTPSTATPPQATTPTTPTTATPTTPDGTAPSEGDGASPSAGTGGTSGDGGDQGP
jgi:type II secretory pathway pseudopilin PulG